MAPSMIGYRRYVRLQQTIQLSKLCRKQYKKVGRQKSEVPEIIWPYFGIKDELVLEGELVFKGQFLVVPMVLRKDVLTMIHVIHKGVEGCIRRARESLYWPGMSTEIKDYVQKCDVCLAHRSSPGKEPILQHEVPERPWAKVGVDLCEFYDRTLLVIVEYYSNFIEVDQVNKTTTSGVTKILKSMFSRYGVPDQVVSDNGPQFASAEFAKFGKQFWPDAAEHCFQLQNPC